VGWSETHTYTASTSPGLLSCKLTVRRSPSLSANLECFEHVAGPRLPNLAAELNNFTPVGEVNKVSPDCCSPCAYPRIALLRIRRPWRNRQVRFNFTIVHLRLPAASSRCQRNDAAGPQDVTACPLTSCASKVSSLAIRRSNFSANAACSVARSSSFVSIRVSRSSIAEGVGGSGSMRAGRDTSVRDQCWLMPSDDRCSTAAFAACSKLLLATTLSG
jgi:hypothetical protein